MTQSNTTWIRDHRGELDLDLDNGRTAYVMPDADDECSSGYFAWGAESTSNSSSGVEPTEDAAKHAAERWLQENP